MKVTWTGFATTPIARPLSYPLGDGERIGREHTYRKGNTVVLGAERADLLVSAWLLTAKLHVCKYNGRQEGEKARLKRATCLLT